MSPPRSNRARYRTYLTRFDLAKRCDDTFSSATRSVRDLSPPQLMEEMGIEPIVTCTPNQHSPTLSTASGGERCDMMKLRSLPLSALTRIQRTFEGPTRVVETSRVFI